MADARDPDEERQSRPADISDYLHEQADQMVDAAEQLEDRANATHVEAERMAGEADQLRDRAEWLHQRADGIDRAIGE